MPRYSIWKTWSKKRNMNQSDYCSTTSNKDISLILSPHSSNTSEIPFNCYNTQQSYEYFKKNVVEETQYAGPVHIVGMAICNSVNVYMSFDDNDIISNLL